MPIPNNKKGEEKKDFLGRCMGDQVMAEEFPDSKQRYAVCQSKWKMSKKKKSKANDYIDPEVDSRVIFY